MNRPAQTTRNDLGVTAKQRLFNRMLTFVLIDLTVLNLFAEHWERVHIDSFTISLFAALLLQVLLKATIHLEHRIGAYFKARPGKTWKLMRLLSAWAILFSSKFVILWAINVIFGDQVQFLGPHHGIVPFIVVVIGILFAETAASRIFHWLR